jgi:5-methylcytosine-specific restriction endonuclease McrA
MTAKGIARRLGVADVTVGRWLRAAGIPARSTSESTSLGMRDWSPSEEHKQKLASNAAKARAGMTPESRKKQGESYRRYVAENGHPMQGKKWTPEQRVRHMATRSTSEYREAAAAHQRGEKGNNWRGGHDQRAPRGWEWTKRRKECYTRDGWTCQDCGVKCHNKVRIQAHHIIPRRLGGSDDLSNLVTLCASCHASRERRYAGALIV